MINHVESVVLGSNLGDCASIMLFDVLLPITDVYGDTSLVIPWYLQGHYKFAILMTLPMLLNYIFTTYKWWSFEDSGNKWWSWMLVLLQLWQPWRAMKVMFLLYKNDDQAQAKKKVMLREVASIEPFLESVPAVFIMTFLWIHGSGGIYVGGPKDPVNYWRNGSCNTNHSDHDYDYFTPRVIIPNTEMPLDKKNFCAIFGGFGGPWWFFTTFVISVLAASLGITKFLQHGPCAIVTTNGALGGMFTGRFLMAFIASILPLVSKAGFGAQLTILATAFSTPGTKDMFGYYVLLFLSLSILPNLLLAIGGIAAASGCNTSLLRVIFEYPAFLLLPVFTNFAVGPRGISKCLKSEHDVPRNQLTISIPFTVLNMVLTFACYVISISISNRKQNRDHLKAFAVIVLPLIICSFCATVVFLSMTKCCYTCCCPARSFKFHYLDTKQINKNIEYEPDRS